MKSNAKQTHNAQDAAQLVQALLDNGVDGRTSVAKNFLAVRDVIHSDHRGVTKSLLESQLAGYAVAQSEVLAAIAQAKTLFEGGELSPLFEQLQRCEASILKISKALQSMDTQQVKADGKAQAPVFDVSSLMDEDGAP